MGAFLRLPCFTLPEVEATIVTMGDSQDNTTGDTSGDRRHDWRHVRRHAMSGDTPCYRRHALRHATHPATPQENLYVGCREDLVTSL